MMNQTNETIRVLLADDHAAVREGIRAILEKAPDIEAHRFFPPLKPASQF